MASLDLLCSATMVRSNSHPAIEFEQHWVTWRGPLCCGALGDLIVASGGARALVAFVARNRPSALAALVGMIARRCTIRMVYPFQSAKAIARDIERIEPSVMVADAEDYSEVAILASCGAAAIALREMEATPLTVPGGPDATHPFRRWKY